MMAETDVNAEQNVTIKIEDDQEVSEVKGCYIWLSESAPSNLFDETEKVSRAKRKKCAVYTCDNVSDKNDTGHRSISFHSFPRDERTRAVWAELCKRTDKFSPRSSFICSDHFKPDDFVKFGRPYEKKYRLRPGSIPSFNLPKLCSNKAEYKIMVQKMCLGERMESCQDEEEENLDINSLNNSSQSGHSSNQNEDDLIESYEEGNGDTDFAKIPHSSSQNKKHPDHSLESTSDVVTISSSDDEDTDKVRVGERMNKRLNEVRDKQLDLLIHQYHNLQRSFEELKTETNSEIKRLNNIIENKEIEFSRELREVLSVFLKPEKVDSIVNQTVW